MCRRCPAAAHYLRPFRKVLTTACRIGPASIHRSSAMLALMLYAVRPLMTARPMTRRGAVGTTPPKADRQRRRPPSPSSISPAGCVWGIFQQRSGGIFRGARFVCMVVVVVGGGVEDKCRSEGQASRCCGKPMSQSGAVRLAERFASQSQKHTHPRNSPG